MAGQPGHSERNPIYYQILKLSITLKSKIFLRQKTMLKLNIGILFLLFSFAMTGNKALAIDEVSICGEPFAPYFFQSNTDPSSVTGMDIQILDAISELTNIKFKTSIVPWKRCLLDVELYSQSGNYEMAIDATYNVERANKYYFLGPLYSAGIHLFYSRKKFPNGPTLKSSGQTISKINQMQHFSICGMLGWNYDIYFERHGIPSDTNIQTTGGGLGSVLNMISADRCEVFETQATLVAGAAINGTLELPEDLGCIEMDEEAPKFYLMLSKSSPRAHELANVISQAFINLGESGKLDQVRDTGLKSVLTDSVKSILNCL